MSEFTYTKKDGSKKRAVASVSAADTVTFLPNKRQKGERGGKAGRGKKLVGTADLPLSDPLLVNEANPQASSEEPPVEAQTEEPLGSSRGDLDQQEQEQEQDQSKKLAEQQEEEASLPSKSEQQGTESQEAPGKEETVTATNPCVDVEDQEMGSIVEDQPQLGYKISKTISEVVGEMIKDCLESRLLKLPPSYSILKDHLHEFCESFSAKLPSIEKHLTPKDSTTTAMHSVLHQYEEKIKQWEAIAEEWEQTEEELSQPAIFPTIDAERVAEKLEKELDLPPIELSALVAATESSESQISFVQSSLTELQAFASTLSEKTREMTSEIDSISFADFKDTNDPKRLLSGLLME